MFLVGIKIYGKRNAFLILSMAGGKKSRAGDAVGRRAKRAGVRDLSLILEVGSRECYNDTTNRNSVGKSDWARGRASPRHAFQNEIRLCVRRNASEHKKSPQLR